MPSLGCFIYWLSIYTPLRPITFLLCHDILDARRLKLLVSERNFYAPVTAVFLNNIIKHS